MGTVPGVLKALDRCCYGVKKKDDWKKTFRLVSQTVTTVSEGFSQPKGNPAGMAMVLGTRLETPAEGMSLEVTVERREGARRPIGWLDSDGKGPGGHMGASATQTSRELS